MPTQICVIVHSYFPEDVRVRKEVEALVEAGHEVDVVALRLPGQRPRENVRGAEVWRLPVRRERTRGLVAYLGEYAGGFTGAAAFVASRFLWRRYDIVHVHNPPDFLVLAALPEKLLGAKLFFDIHDMVPDFFASRFGIRQQWILRWLERIERMATRLADAVITVHEDYRSILMQKGVPGGKIVVVMNAADARVFAKERIGRVERPRDGTFRLIYNGLLTDRYGVDLIVDAAARLRGKIPGLRVDLFGEGPLWNDLERRIENEDLGDVVGLHRKVPIERIPKLLMQADVCVAPNRSDAFMQYALNTKLMEAAALGRALIVARTHTVARYFDESMVEFVEPGSADSLADAVWKLYRNPKRREAIASAIARFDREHNWARQKQELLALVERRTGSRR